MSVNRVGSYSFLKLMPSNKMSTKDNILHLPPRFPSTSSSESESEIQFSSFKKRGKHHKENEAPLKKRKMESLNGEVWLFTFFSK